MQDGDPTFRTNGNQDTSTVSKKNTTYKIIGKGCKMPSCKIHRLYELWTRVSELAKFIGINRLFKADKDKINKDME